MKRTAPLKRRTPLRKASPKRAKDMVLYRQERDAWLQTQRSCHHCNAVGMLELHHFRGRAGSLLRDVRFWLSLCGGCHRQVYDNPKWARANLLLASATDFNRSPKE